MSFVCITAFFASKYIYELNFSNLQIISPQRYRVLELA